MKRNDQRVKEKRNTKDKIKMTLSQIDDRFSFISDRIITDKRRKDLINVKTGNNIKKNIIKNMIRKI